MLEGRESLVPLASLKHDGGSLVASLLKRFCYTLGIKGSNMRIGHYGSNLASCRILYQRAYPVENPAPHVDVVRA